MIFQKKLENIIKYNNSLVCIGLDPVLEKLPKHLLGKQYPLFEFNKQIINATYDLVCCYKPNSAFYEAHGQKGIGELKKTCDYLIKNYPDVPIILDAKRGDIASSNEAYVSYAFEYLRADGVTLHPYLGKESLLPFLKRKEKECIILCHTTNTGAEEIQDEYIGTNPLYQVIAKKVINKWNYNKNCMLVLGARYPEQMAYIRKLSNDLFFLVPGVGTQKGNIEEIMKAGLNEQKTGMLINSSRGIIFASSDRDFAQKAREKATDLKEAINKYR